MKLVLFSFLLSVFFCFAASKQTKFDCDFDAHKRAFCGWKREWFGMRKAGWKSGKRIRRFELRDHASENVYVVGVGETVESKNPVWTKSSRTSNVTTFEKISLHLDDVLPTMPESQVQFVFEAIRGKSKRSIVAIDDVSLKPCQRDRGFAPSVGDRPTHSEANMKMHDVERELLDLMLPARRGQIATLKFQDIGVPALPSAQSNRQLSSLHSPTTLRRNKSAKRRGWRRRKGKRGKGRKQRRPHRNRARKNKRRNRNRVGKVMFDETDSSRRRNRPSSFPVMCDFIEYTSRLKRCFRDFFSTIQHRPRQCRSQYDQLESCLVAAATSCAQTRALTPSRINEIVIGTLRKSFQVKRVFCEEDGAFVYPQFPLDKLPIHCGSRYFIKLSECSGSFNTMFHTQHGNPHLCKVYYKANQCQRQATAEECNFDVETMLLYGLNLQYQIAYNPFCLNLPFSSWWPDS